MQVTGLLRRLAQLPAQPRYVHVDGLVRAAVRQVPDVREQVTAGCYLSLPQRQVMQQVEFAAAEIERRAVQGGLVTVWVEPEAADGEQVGGRLAAWGRPAEHRTDPGLDLARAERLDHIVVGPGVEHPDDLGLV